MDQCLDDVALSDPNFSTLVSLLQMANMTGLPCYNENNDISSTEYNQTAYKMQQITLLAPTNDAFDKLPSEYIPALQLPQNIEALKKLLLGKVLLSAGSKAPTREREQHQAVWTSQIAFCKE